MARIMLEAGRGVLAAVELGQASQSPGADIGYFDAGDPAAYGGNLYLFADGLEIGSLFFHTLEGRPNRNGPKPSPDSYQMLGTRRVQQILAGNAVPPPCGRDVVAAAATVHAARTPAFPRPRRKVLDMDDLITTLHTLIALLPLLFLTVGLIAVFVVRCGGGSRWASAFLGVVLLFAAMLLLGLLARGLIPVILAAPPVHDGLAGWLIGAGTVVCLSAVVVNACLGWHSAATLHRLLRRAQARIDCADPVDALTHLSFYSTATVIAAGDGTLARLRHDLPRHGWITRGTAGAAVRLCDDVDHAWDLADTLDLTHNDRGRAERRRLADQGLDILMRPDCAATDRAVAARLILAAGLPRFPQAATATLHCWVEQAPVRVWPTLAEHLPGAVTEPVSEPSAGFTRRWRRRARAARLELSAPTPSVNTQESEVQR